MADRPALGWIGRLTRSYIASPDSPYYGMYILKHDLASFPARHLNFCTQLSLHFSQPIEPQKNDTRDVEREVVHVLREVILLVARLVAYRIKYIVQQVFQLFSLHSLLRPLCTQSFTSY